METVKLVGISLGGPRRELAPERAQLCLRSRRGARDLFFLRVGQRTPVGCGERGAKDLFAVFALHAPIDVLGADPHVRALAVRAGNTDVTRHRLLESPIMEAVKFVGVSLSRYTRRQLGARQEALPSCASVLAHGGRWFLTGVIIWFNLIMTFGR